MHYLPNQPHPVDVMLDKGALLPLPHLQKLLLTLGAVSPFKLTGTRPETEATSHREKREFAPGTVSRMWLP